MRTGFPLSTATLQIVENCSSRAIGIFRQQDVPVVMKIADDRRHASQIAQPRHNFRDRRRRLRHVHRDAHQL
jgi:hypothetical protein